MAPGVPQAVQVGLGIEVVVEVDYQGESSTWSEEFGIRVLRPSRLVPTPLGVENPVS